MKCKCTLNARFMLLSRSLSHLILTLHLHFNACFAGKEKCMHVITEFITSDCSKFKHIRNKSILRTNVRNQSEGRSASAPLRHRGWAGLLKDHRASWLQDYACENNPGVITVLRDAWLNVITVKRCRCVQGPRRAPNLYSTSPDCCCLSKWRKMLISLI